MKPIPSGSSAADPFALEHFLPYRLSVLTNTVSRAIAGLYGRRFGLAVPEWRVMAVLGRFAPLSASELCARTAMDKVQVSRAVAAMLAKGLLARATDAADRRRSRLSLSAKGAQIHAAIVPLARAAEARLLAGLSGEDLTTMDRLLALLMDRAVRLDADLHGESASQAAD